MIIDAHAVVLVDAYPAIAASAFVLDCLAGDCDRYPMVKGDMMEDASIATEYGSSGDFFNLSPSCTRLLRDFESHFWLVKISFPIAILVVNLTEVECGRMLAADINCGSI